jgi:hypothetical protein
VGGLIGLALVLVIRNQVEVYLRGVERSAEMRQRQPPPTLPADVITARREMFNALRPVTISNCALERIGERNDGAYLMCGNLLDRVQSGYSYGIGGHDAWGCEISNRTGAAVHQYDCFDPYRPWCWRGDTVFHDECVGGTTETIEGRPFDTVPNQVAENGDAGKRIVLKMDVEGAEWDSILAMPDDMLARVDQISVEFHWREDQALGWVHDPRYLAAVRHLKRFFEVAHIHFNNMTCVGNLAPFPAHAFEVLFVSKELAVVDPALRPTLPHPEDTPTRWWLTDCQLQSVR